MENNRQIHWHRTPVALECTWYLWLTMLDWAHSPTVFSLQHFFCPAPDVPFICSYLKFPWGATLPDPSFLISCLHSELCFYPLLLSRYCNCHIL
jgi:hypothetical protein